ncbi:hypothetical protein [Nocardioides daphniae]|uniref:Uncharacterized protein n=1 Tax=Nocardioides daphniae TaxID=402297 RepID=A0ABQ1Q3L8_9ACTN|nr:hypothetical protein [Nocardioides daphniae]GGD11785.1 hypothetical protein GCM10007231_08300 [Nocardioides daphniae]
MGEVDPLPLHRRLEVGRLVVGAAADMTIRAYGAAAALSVVVSDAETVSGKSGDAVAAVPHLLDRYHQAQYVIDHRQEIQAAIDYVDQHTPPQAELQARVEEAGDTLRDIEATSDAVARARDAAERLDVREAFGQVREAWQVRPDRESIQQLAEAAEEVAPYAEQVEVLVPVYQGGVVAAVDNFASDEVAGTVFVMVVALVVAALLGQAVGFWIRRGRPGLIASAWQQLGARVFRDWYVRHLPFALGGSVHAVARERFQRDLVADPEAVLDPDVLAALERHFAAKPPPDA